MTRTWASPLFLGVNPASRSNEHEESMPQVSLCSLVSSYPLYEGAREAHVLRD